jgi:hypothetical protein
LLKECFKMFESRFRFGNNHDSVGFFIQSVDEPCTNEVAVSGQIFEMMIEKSDNGWLFYISNAVGMGEDSFWFI